MHVLRKITVIYHTQLNCKVLFLGLSVTFLFFFVCESNMLLEWVNRFAPNSQGRRVWSLAWMSLNVKLKGQGHEGQKHCALPSHPAAVEWNAFAANNVSQQQTGPFHHCQG